MPRFSNLSALLLLGLVSSLGAQPAGTFRDLSFRGELAVLALVEAPSDPARLYALLPEGYLLRSSDGGSSFAPVSPFALDRSNTGSLLADPLDADGVYLVTLNPFTVQRSGDGGAGFAPLALPEGASGFWLDASATGRWYSSRHTRLLRHDDGGWTELAEILPGNTDAMVASLAIDGLDPRHLLAGIGSGASGIYESTDGGASWSWRLDALHVPQLSFDPLDPSFAWAVTFNGGDSELWRSTDGGASWNRSSVGRSYTLRFVFDPARSGHLLVVSHFRHSASNEHYLTRDQGATFHPVALPFGDSVDYTVTLLADGRWVLTSRDPSAATYTESSDLFASWRSLQPMPARLAALTLDPGEPEHAWAITVSGVYRTTNGGASWVPVFAADVPFTTAQLAVDPEDPRFLLLANSRFTAGPFLWRSGDRGRTWHEALRSTGAIYLDSLVAGRRDGRPFALASFETEDFADVLFRSEDLGGGWQTLPGESAHGAAVRVEDGLVYRLAGRTIERSLDGGLHFAPVADFSPLGVIPTSVVPGPGQRLFALAATDPVSGGSRLFEMVSADPPRERFLPTTDGFRLAGRLAVGRRPGELYFTPNEAITPNPLWMSDDSGTSWAAVRGGLPRGSISSLLTSPADGSLWVVPYSFGVFRGRADFADPSLPLQKERFAVRAKFRDGAGQALAGKPRLLTGETGYFTLGPGERIEAVVKILDGRPLTGAFWFFAASLNRLGLELEVEDRETGQLRRFVHPAGSLASFADFGALAPPPPPPALRPEAAGTATATAGGRFEVTVTWRDFGGEYFGEGQPLRLADENTLAFSFFWPANLEVFVRVVDSRSENRHFGVVVAGLSNVEYTVTVRDLVTGREWQRRNPLGTFASIEDPLAFPSD